LGKRDNKFVYLKDVARIVDSFKEVTLNVRISGRKGMMMMIQKQTDTNTVEVAARVKKRLEELKNVLPRDISMYPIFDTSQDIIDSRSPNLLWLGIGCDPRGLPSCASSCPALLSP
jgi:HAE1 family hydrophobic/amphiphilic exporter-1